MFDHRHGRRRSYPFYIGLAPTIYVVSLTIGIAITLLRGGTWPLPPPGSGQVTVDLLQSLGFLVALTALVSAVSLRVLSGLKGYSDTMDETLRVHDELCVIHQAMHDDTRSNEKEDVPTRKFSCLWVSKTIQTLRKFTESARTRFPWFLLVYGLIYITLRGQWMFSHASLSSGESGTTLITINGLATISFVTNWMMIVICMTERIIHVGRTLKRRTDLDLEDAKTALRRHQNH